MGKPGRGSEEELLEATMARAREEEDEFLQAVPQDVTMNERQAEVCFRMHLEQLVERTRNEGLWRARLEEAGWLPL